MLSVKTIKADGKSRGGDHIKYLIATEYYRDAHGEKVAASRWWGKGAEDLGLKGAPQETEMLSLARGFAPGKDGKDGRALCRNAGSAGRERVLKRKDRNGNPIVRVEGAHRVGADWTFSAPKTVSVAYAAAAPEMRDRIMAAHEAAVTSGLEWLQQNAETRRGAQGRDVIGAGLVASVHNHVAARPTDEDGNPGPDIAPQLHSHCLIYSVCVGEDGKWGKISQEEMRRQIRSAGAIYRAALAYEMRKLGFGVEKEAERDHRDNPNGSVYFRVVGIDQHVEDAFSKRRQALLKYMEENPGVSAQTATLATRKDKEEPPFDELLVLWDRALNEMRLEDPTIFKTTEDLRGRPDNFGEKVRDEDVLARLHETEAVWTRAQLIERLALENVGRMSVADIYKEADDFLARNRLIEVAPPDLHEDDRGRRLAIRHRESNWADMAEVQREQEFVKRAQARKSDPSVALDAARATQFLADFQKSNGFVYQPEQQAVIDSVIGAGGAVVIGGRAGTGKTFTSAGWIGAFKDQGRDVIGAAVSWKAAKKLESESGIESFSTAALLRDLERGTIALHERSVVVLDEAAMAGTKTVLKLQQYCDAAKAKLVLQGDELQLQPIESGSPFRLAAAAVGEVHLSDIRRQKSQADRETASAFYGRDEKLRSRRENRELGLQVLERLEKNEQVLSFETQKDAVGEIVANYLKVRAGGNEKDRDMLVLGGTNADVALLNHAMRKGFHEAGLLSTNSVKVAGLEGSKKVTMAVSVGDRVRFAQGSRDLGVFNGEVAVVEGIAQQNGRTRLTTRLESDVQGRDGMLVTVDAEAYGALSYGYATTVHKAQGQGVNRVFQLANLGMIDRQLALVSFTRMKENYCLYGTHDALDSEVLGERLGTDRLKVNATERLKAREQQKKEEQRKAQEVQQADERKQEKRRLLGLVKPAPRRSKRKEQAQVAPTKRQRPLADLLAPMRDVYDRTLGHFFARIKGRGVDAKRSKQVRADLAPKPKAKPKLQLKPLPALKLRPPGSDKPWEKKPWQTPKVGY